MSTRVAEAPPCNQRPVEISVVMPCLNEAETVGACVSKALGTLREHGIPGEVIVAGNGSALMGGVALFVDVLHHANDPALLLREAARVIAVLEPLRAS